MGMAIKAQNSALLSESLKFKMECNSLNAIKESNAIAGKVITLSSNAEQTKKITIIHHEFVRDFNSFKLLLGFNFPQIKKVIEANNRRENIITTICRISGLVNRSRLRTNFFILFIIKII
ncbi:hypothetical protein D3C87_1637790 [compost metagenome]